MTDGPPWLQLPLCCLPPSSEYLVPQGSDQKAQAGLSLLLWKAVDTEGKNWEVRLRMKLGAKFPGSLFSPREAREQLLLRSSLPSCIPCLQRLEEQGQGEQEVLIYHIGAVVSSSFIVWSDTHVECVKCVDFVSVLRRNVMLKGHVSPSPFHCSVGLEPRPAIFTAHWLRKAILHEAHSH